MWDCGLFIASFLAIWWSLFPANEGDAPTDLCEPVGITPFQKCPRGDDAYVSFEGNKD